MRYKNIKTGAIVDSSCKIVGKNWVEVTGVKGEAVEEVSKTEEYVEEEINLEEMTNKQLDKFAEEQGIKLSTEDKKNKDTRIAAIAKAFE
ncbi:hypothetical protein [Oceanobacillus indicireducens]|uniref:Uncharacterized protein n=1 Tax=Oceanobacillus indicireducens TaxID=1004261 RepID=A0A917XWN8_9BACI|nr:hypothetical protein [Oceanobacillus indicireducens]GGN54860.1 hypothetical protein GCM10007971_13080 [Oceanobacillus indicireducens]